MLSRTDTRTLAVMFGCLLSSAVSGPAAAQDRVALGVSASPRRGKVPLDVRLTLILQGDLASATLDWGDGSPPRKLYPRITGPKPMRHRYRKSGTFRVRLTAVTESGATESSSVRIRVSPRREANPRELLRLDRRHGLAPHLARFRVGGKSLPFKPTLAVLDFGDGSKQHVRMNSEVKHTYAKTGRYTATLTVVGKFDNVARARRRLRVSKDPKPMIRVVPPRGYAPLEVDVDSAVGLEGVHSQLLMDGKVIGPAGRRRLTIAEPGKHVFELRVLAANGEKRSTRSVVEVLKFDVSGLYVHRNSVVRIRSDGGVLQGTIEVPSPEMAIEGYEPGEPIVRGVFAHELRPRDYLPKLSGKDPSGARRTRGGYLVRNPKPGCPPQWGEYGFQIDLGTAPLTNKTKPEQRTRLGGYVYYKPWTTPRKRAKRLRGKQPRMSGGIIGGVKFVPKMLDADTGGVRKVGPDDCIHDEEPSESRYAEFVRITRDQAEKQVRQTQKALREMERLVQHLASKDGDYAGQFDPQTGVPAFTKEPVILHSGEFFLTETDLELPGSSIEGPGAGLTWRFRRTYRSRTQGGTSLGWGWSHSDMHALVKRGDAFWFRGGLGSFVKLTPAGAGRYTHTGGLTLTVSSDGKRIVRDAQGLTYRFVARKDGARSAIRRVEDRAGNHLTYTTDILGRVLRVTDRWGRSARYRYAPRTGLLRHVIAPNGQRVHFRHDKRGNLIRVDRFAPRASTPHRTDRYAYAASKNPDLDHNMVKLWLPDHTTRRQPSVEMRYGQDPSKRDFDRVVWQRDGRSVERLAYLVEAKRAVTTVAARGLAVQRYEFDAGGHLLRTTLTDPKTKTALVTSIERDKAGRVLARVEPAGNRLEITRDAAGLPTQVIRRPRPGSREPAIVHVVEYDPALGVRKAVYGPFAGAAPADPAQRERALQVRMEYHPTLGKVTKITTRDPASKALVHTVIRYDARGLLETVTDPAGVVTTITYAQPRVGPPQPTQIVRRAKSGEREVVAVYEWDERGRLVGYSRGGERFGVVRDALGRATHLIPADTTEPRLRFVHDGQDRLREVWALSEAEHLNGLRGRRIEATDYGSRGDVLKVTRWASATEALVTTYTYDAYRRPASANTGGRVRVWRYDAFGRVIEEAVARHPSSRRTYTYDLNGRVVARRDAFGAKQVLTWDGLGRLAAITDALGRRRTFSYDLHSRVTGSRAWGANKALLGAEGLVHPPTGGGATAAWSGRPDAAGKLLRAQVHVQRDVSGRVVGVTQGDVSGLVVDRDGLGRPTWTLRGGRLVTERVWDAFGRARWVRTITEDVDVETRFDRRGRPLELSKGGKVVVRWRRDAMLGTLAVDDLTSRRTLETTTDGAGRVIRSRLVVGEQVVRDVAVAYDPRGFPSRLTHGKQVLASLTWDHLGRPLRQQYWGGSTTTFAYGRKARRAVRTDARGNRVVETYDAAGRRVGLRTFPRKARKPSQIEVIDYDARNRVVRHQRGPWERRHTYDAAGNRTAEVLRHTGEKIEYAFARTFSTEGEPTRVKLPSGRTVRYGKTRDGVDTIHVAGQQLECIYDGNGDLVAVLTGKVALLRAPGLSASRPAGVELLVDAKPRLRYAYGYDSAGELSGWRLTTGGQTLVATLRRDARGRLIGGSLPLPGGSGLASRAFTYAWDARGNRSQPGGSKTEGYRLTQVAGAAMTHDADGNVTAWGARRFTHDAAGDLSSVDGITYQRDGWGRVVERRSKAGGVRRYVHDVYGLAVELQDGKVVREYLRDAAGELIALVADGAVYLCLTAPDRTLLALVDPQGKVRQQVLYDAFGTPYAVGPTGKQEAPLSALLFHGMLHDAEVGLYLLPHRAYAPTLGRCLEPEPLGPLASSHPYGFANDDPTRFTDRGGLEPRTKIEDDLTTGTLQERLVKLGYRTIGGFERGRQALDWVTGKMDGKNKSMQEYQRITSGFTAWKPDPKAGFERRFIDRLKYDLITDMVGTAFGPAAVTVLFKGAGALLKHGLPALAKGGAAVLGRVAKVAGKSGQFLSKLRGVGSRLSSRFAGRAGGRLASGSRVGNALGKGPKGRPPARLSPKTKAQIRETYCFLPGTRVVTARGARPIEEVRVGDRVLARDPHTGAQAFKPVVGLFSGRTELVCRITLPGSRVLSCTPGHEVYRADAQTWVRATDLVAGDTLRGADGQPVRVVGVAVTRQLAPTRNLQVADDHTYFVAPPSGGVGVWVHNLDCATKTRRALFKRQAKALDDVPGGHTYSKHGAQTKPRVHQQRVREAATRAVNPRPGTTSSKFANHKLHVEAGQEAERLLWNQNLIRANNNNFRGNVTFRFQMGGRQTGTRYSWDANAGQVVEHRMTWVEARFSYNPTRSRYEMYTMFPSAPP